MVKYFVVIILCFFSSFEQKATELNELEIVMNAKSRITNWSNDPIGSRQSINDVLNAMNRDWQHADHEKLAIELEMLWYRKHDLNDVDRHKLLDENRVRIQIAGFLGMSERLCFDTVRKDILRSFILAYVQNNNVSERILAIRMLPYVGNIDDIELLTKIVKQEEEGVATWAAISLDNLHLPNAVNALETLENYVSSVEIKESIQEILKPYREGRSIPKCLCREKESMKKGSVKKGSELIN